MKKRQKALRAIRCSLRLATSFIPCAVAHGYKRSGGIAAVILFPLFSQDEMSFRMERSEMRNLSLSLIFLTNTPHNQKMIKKRTWLTIIETIFFENVIYSLLLCN